eukprot:6032383-Prymnesium_polylepis.1
MLESHAVSRRRCDRNPARQRASLSPLLPSREPGAPTRLPPAAAALSLACSLTAWPPPPRA